ncbi:MAG TPA: MarR family winged helix-turn-helix transcriptional regulator [Solirubrobacteraceae bacterium]|nr:MarR family winged helix-turn-helix transcriptional regulator [Solirubrobacteraceae bacterium]
MSDAWVGVPASGVAGGPQFAPAVELGAATASLGQPFGVGGLGAASSPMATVLVFPLGCGDRSGGRVRAGRDGGQLHGASQRASVPTRRVAAAGASSDGGESSDSGERPVRTGEGEGWSSPLAPWRIRALRYIAAHPGAGSREIAASGSASCACETSTLLRRMEELDFVEHMPRPDARRGAWHLTAHGHLAVSAADRPRSHLVAV